MKEIIVVWIVLLGVVLSGCGKMIGKWNQVKNVWTEAEIPRDGWSFRVILFMA